MYVTIDDLQIKTADNLIGTEYILISDVNNSYRTSIDSFNNVITDGVLSTISLDFTTGNLTTNTLTVNGLSTLSDINGKSLSLQSDIVYTDVGATGDILSIRDSEDNPLLSLQENGDFTVNGNLIVNGTNTILNTTTLDVEDINITIANGSADKYASNNAGITIDLGTDGTANILYNASTDSLDIDQNIFVGGETKTNTLRVQYDVDNDVYASGNQGLFTWNSDELTVNLDTGSSVIQLGQEQLVLVRNDSGADITNGTVLMATGSLGNSGRITVSPMTADGTNSKYIVGVATEDILNGSDGYCTTFGKVRGVSTDGSASGETWVDGTVLYVKPNDGGLLTSVEPTDTEAKMPVAFVIHAHANNGTLFVRVNAFDENHMKPWVETNFVKQDSAQALHSTSALSFTSNTLSLNKADGTSESIDLSSYLDNQNDYLSGATFNTVNGDLTLSMSGSNSLSDIVLNLDGRYLTSETDSQTLSWTEGTKNLSISNGNSIEITGFENSFSKNTAFNKNFGTISGTVAEGNHTHNSSDYNHDDLVGFVANEHIDWTIDNVTNDIHDNNLSSNVTVQGNTFNGNSQLVQTTADGKLPALDGSNLTGVSTANYYATSFSWTDGTGSGPTGTLSVSGTSDVSFGAIPTASGTVSGIITTITQTFAGNKTFSDNVTANSFVKSGGTSSQFLKADGSVDSTNYLTSYVNNYISGLSFNTADGVLTASRSGLTDLTVDLDGRYLQSETSHDDVVVDGDFTPGTNGFLKKTADGVYSVDSNSYSLSTHVHEGTEIDATGITDGYVLTADGLGNSVWESLPASSTTLSDLTDTTITTPTSGQILSYNGSSWVNSPAPTGFDINVLSEGTETDMDTADFIPYYDTSAGTNNKITVANLADELSTSLAGTGLTAVSGTLTLNFNGLSEYTEASLTSDDFIPLYENTGSSHGKISLLNLGDYLQTQEGWTTNAGTVTSIATSGAISGGTITSSGTISHLDTTGYKHIPSGGSSGQVLGWSADGTATWTDVSGSDFYMEENEFTATASQTTFTVTYTVGAVEVYRNGLKLSASDYTATNGTSIVLTTGADAGDLITVLTYQKFAVQGDSYTYTSTEQTASASQTVFTVSYDASVLEVYMNGIKLSNTDYTASNGTSVTLNVACVGGEILNFVTLSSVSLAEVKEEPTAEDNAINFAQEGVNNFELTATSANITVSSIGTISKGKSGIIIIHSAENITGWSANYKFKNVPTDLSGDEIFSYYIDSSFNIWIGRVQ